LTRQITRVGAAVLVAAAVVAGPYAYSEARQKHLRNFRVVEDRVLYRAGQPSPAGLERVIHDYDIRTVVSFREHRGTGEPGTGDDWEAELCRIKGINHVRIPIQGWWTAPDGVVPGDEDVRRFLDLMADRRNHPVLAHCYRLDAEPHVRGYLERYQPTGKQSCGR
jgi:tyrosine-protein phosphatase SIW14